MSADTFQLKRGTTASVATYVAAQGEPVYDTQLKQLRLGDGTTAGGVGVAPTESPTLTGTPVAPTAVVDTSTTQVATTAYVLGQAGGALPVVNGIASAGTSPRYSRMDHIHPTDTSRAPLASPSFTGTPLSTTPAVGTNTTQIATAAMIQAEIGNKRAWTSYTPTVTAGSGTYTSASATGRYMVAFGICFFQVTVTVTTVGTGVQPVVTLPFAALTGSSGMPIPAKEGSLNGKTGSARILGSLLSVQCTDYNNADLVTGNGAIVTIAGSYPIA